MADKINPSELIISSKINQSDPLDGSGMIMDNMANLSGPWDEIRVIMTNEIKQTGPCDADVVFKVNEINNCDDGSVKTNNEINQSGKCEDGIFIKESGILKDDCCGDEEINEVEVINSNQINNYVPCDVDEVIVFNKSIQSGPLDDARVINTNDINHYDYCEDNTINQPCPSDDLGLLIETDNEKVIFTKVSFVFLIIKMTMFSQDGYISEGKSDFQNKLIKTEKL